MLRLPKNLDLEKEILATILVEPKVLEKIEIKTEYFYDPKYGLFLEKIFETYNPTTKKIKKKTLYSLIPKEYIKELTELSEAYYTSVGIEKKVEELKKIWRKREFVKTFVAGKERLKNKEDIDTILQESIKNLQAIISGNDIGEMEKIGDVLDSVFKEFSESLKNNEDDFSFRTGYTDLDNMIELKRGSLTIIAARPSMGKTTFSMNLMRRQVELGYRVGFFSLEMSKKQIIDKFCIMTTETGFSKLVKLYKEGGDPEDILEDFSKKVEDIENWDLWLDDSPAMKLSSLTMKIRKLVNFHKVDIIYIDYLSYILPDRREQSKNLEIENITRTLKALAKELNIAIILLSQLNRGVEGRKDKKPILSDLRESGAIEQDADIVIMLYRPFYYSQNSVDENVLEVLIRKNREGGIGEIKMLFFPEKQLVECGYWENEE